MSRRGIYRALAAAVGALVAIMPGCVFAADADPALIARGRYLAIAGDCQPCHTAMGQTPFSGGRKVETPFGVIVSANITPDPETGIGGWTEEQFVAAVQRGEGVHGEHLYPAMPYPYFAKANRDDVRAIFAYLKSLPPKKNAVNTDTLPFPFNQRILMMGWNLLFFHGRGFKPETGKSTDWNRGAYLVEGLGHCGACHTPKNIFGADRRGAALQGGAIQEWSSSNLTGDQHVGLGPWSSDDLVGYLKTGHNRTADAGGPMAEVVSQSTSAMADTDLQAIAAYLKGQPADGAKTAPMPMSQDVPTMEAGAAIFTDECAPCHAASGDGAEGLFTHLSDSAVVRADDPTTVIRVVLDGVQGASTAAAPTAAAMPSFKWKLSDAQIAAVVTYIRNSWHNTGTEVSPNTIAKLRAKLAKTDDMQ